MAIQRHLSQAFLRMRDDKGNYVDKDNQLTFITSDVPSIYPETYDGFAYFYLENAAGELSLPDKPLIVDRIFPVYAVDDYGQKQNFVPSALYKTQYTEGFSSNEQELCFEFDDSTGIPDGDGGTWYPIDKVKFYFYTNNVDPSDIMEIQNLSRSVKYFFDNDNPNATDYNEEATYTHNETHPLDIQASNAGKDPIIGIPVSAVTGLKNKEAGESFYESDGVTLKPLQNIVGDNYIHSSDVIVARYNYRNPILTTWQGSYRNVSFGYETKNIPDAEYFNSTYLMPHNINAFPKYSHLKVYEVNAPYGLKDGTEYWKLDDPSAPQMMDPDWYDESKHPTAGLGYSVSSPNVSTGLFALVNHVDTIFSVVKGRTYQFHNPSESWEELFLTNKTDTTPFETSELELVSSPVFDGDPKIPWPITNPSSTRYVDTVTNPSDALWYDEYPTYIEVDRNTPGDNWKDPDFVDVFGDESVKLGTTGFCTQYVPSPSDYSGGTKPENRSIYMYSNENDMNYGSECFIKVVGKPAIGIAFVHFIDEKLFDPTSGLHNEFYPKTWPAPLADVAGTDYTDMDPVNTMYPPLVQNGGEEYWGKQEYRVTGTDIWSYQGPSSFPLMTLSDPDNKILDQKTNNLIATPIGASDAGVSIDGSNNFYSLERYHPYPFPWGKDVNYPDNYYQKSLGNYSNEIAGNKFRLLWQVFPFYDHLPFGDPYASIEITHDDMGEIKYTKTDPTIMPGSTFAYADLQILDAKVMFNILQTIRRERRENLNGYDSAPDTGVYTEGSEFNNHYVILNNHVTKVTRYDFDNNMIRLATDGIPWQTGHMIHTAIKEMHFIWNMNPNHGAGYIFRFRGKDDDSQTTYSKNGLNHSKTVVSDTTRPGYVNGRLLGIAELDAKISYTLYGMHVKAFYDSMT